MRRILRYPALLRLSRQPFNAECRIKNAELMVSPAGDESEVLEHTMCAAATNKATVGTALGAPQRAPKYGQNEINMNKGHLYETVVAM